MNPQLDPAQLKKRMLIFYFAAGVNFLMAFWVWSVGSGRTAGTSLLLIVVVFLAFAGVNYYMARRINKFLNRLRGGAPAANLQPGSSNKTNE